MEKSAITKTALIVGATSSLAQAMCRTLAGRGWRLVLAGRDAAELDIVSADLKARFHATSRTVRCDFLAPEFSPPQFLHDAGDFTHLIMAAGDMGNGNAHDLADIAYTMHVNYTAPAQICAAAAEQLSARGGGSIVIISSVAGDRGRGKILAYGSAKAALTAFASALRQAYSKQHVDVMTVKPGFVDTSMTWGMTSPLMARREDVAETIIEAMEKKKDVIYVPGFWRLIMLIIRHIPESIFKRLSF